MILENNKGNSHMFLQPTRSEYMINYKVTE